MKNVVRKIGLEGWSTSDYQPIPDFKGCSEYTEDWETSEYDLMTVNWRYPIHTFTHTVDNPILSELAKHNPYVYRIWIHTRVADRKGIKDGDRVTVEVEPIPIVKVVETNVTQVGDNLYDCQWYFAFTDGTTGILDYVTVGQFKSAYTLHYTTPEYDGYWGSVGVYNDDYIKVMVGPVSSDWITVEIEWIDDSEIGYEGDGDPITIYRD